MNDAHLSQVPKRTHTRSKVPPKLWNSRYKCQQKLVADALFCSACGTGVNGTVNQQPNKPERICRGSGKLICEADIVFQCQQCDHFFLEQYQFADRPVCTDCAHKSGVDSYLEQERKTQQQQIEREVKDRLESLSDAIRKELYKELNDGHQVELAELGAMLELELQAKREVQEGKKTEEIAQEARANSSPIKEEDFVSIPAGTFMMGEDDDLHRVAVEAFELMKTPVTFGQYKKYCKNAGREVPDNEGWEGDQRPVINVSYWDAVDFCKWLTEQSGQQYCLPSEVEWEYACRAGTTTNYSYGDHPNRNLMHCLGDSWEDSNSTINVASFPPNHWGLYDMHGNVLEWCDSVYESELQSNDKEVGENKDDLRVLRGGAWMCLPYRCRSASRGSLTPASRYPQIGFRVARISKS